MEIKPNISFYDFISYITNGFIFLIILNILYFQDSYLFNLLKNLNIAIVVIIIVSFSYIAGHLISLLSGYIIRSLFMNLFLKVPSINLLRESVLKYPWILKIFGLYNYKMAYDSSVIKHFKKKYRKNVC